jgi:hypothetical protein
MYIHNIMYVCMYVCMYIYIYIAFHGKIMAVSFCVRALVWCHRVHRNVRRTELHNIEQKTAITKSRHIYISHSQKNNS